MQRLLNNIIQSKKPPMIFLRYLLLGVILFMGIARLRFTLLLLVSPENYQQRDILQIYLMSKALASGMSPYTPLYRLAEEFVGVFPFFPHPAPYPPFTAILFIPLTWLGIKISVFTWYGIEILFLAAIACLLVVFWKGKLHAAGAGVIFLVLLAWYPVMADLAVGQLSILLTLLVLAALVAMQRGHKGMAGILIGISAAIKLVTWPVIIYFVLKKEWKAALASGLTSLLLNLIALLVMGIDPFMDYYLSVSSWVMDIYHKFWANFSLYTVGYRLFEGIDSAIFANNYHAPPLVYIPALAAWVSVSLVVLTVVVCLVWAVRSSRVETAFALLASLVVVISPIVWDHYYVLVIISLVVVLRNLARQNFPAGTTWMLLAWVLLFFLLIDRIGTLMILLNGGQEAVEAGGSQLTFLSSLVSWLPLVEMIGLIYLVKRSDRVEVHAGQPVPVLTAQ